MKTNLEKSFDLFVGEDNARNMLSKPFCQDGYVYATDLHVIIRCKESDCDFEVDKSIKGISNPSSVFLKPNMNRVLDLNDSAFEKIKTEDEYTFHGENKKCKECRGDGEVYWEYEHHEMLYECPECGGSGFSEEKIGVKTGNKTFGHLSKVRLGESYFNAPFFYKLMEVKKQLGSDIKLVRQVSNDRASNFEVGNCEIAIMPVLVDDYGKQDKKNLLEIEI